MGLVAKNKKTGENVITVEAWLETIDKPEYVEAWNTRSNGPTPIFDEMWYSYLEAVNAEMVEEHVPEDDEV